MERASLVGPDGAAGPERPPPAGPVLPMGAVRQHETREPPCTGTIPKPMPTTAPPKEQIPFGDLARIDIRVGTIREVSDIPHSRKLVRLTVDLGFGTRTVVVGMKQEREDPGAIEGAQALFVVNLPPRRMAGFVSEAMLFDLGYSDGIAPALAIPERPVPDGTRAG